MMRLRPIHKVAGVTGAYLLGGHLEKSGRREFSDPNNQYRDISARKAAIGRALKGAAVLAPGVGLLRGKRSLLNPLTHVGLMATYSGGKDLAKAAAAGVISRDKKPRSRLGGYLERSVGERMAADVLLDRRARRAMRKKKRIKEDVSFLFEGKSIVFTDARKLKSWARARGFSVIPHKGGVVEIVRGGRYGDVVAATGQLRPNGSISVVFERHS